MLRKRKQNIYFFGVPYKRLSQYRESGFPCIGKVAFPILEKRPCKLRVNRLIILVFIRLPVTRNYN